jgi:hypothetical protein
MQHDGVQHDNTLQDNTIQRSALWHSTVQYKGNDAVWHAITLMAKCGKRRAAQHDGSNNVVDIAKRDAYP